MAKTGALATAFLVSYMILAPLFGWLADKHSRWAIIGTGAAIWSLATAGSGWAPTFGILLAARILVGAGEAAYGPAAPTLLSDLFPPARLGLVLAWFFAAIPFGSAVGYLFGGAMAGAFGWRAPFHFAAIPGLLLAGLCLLTKEKRPAGKARRRATIEDYRGLMRIPSYLYNVPQTAMTFAIGGMSFWRPAYFYEQRGQADLERMNLIFGGITAIAGLSAPCLEAGSEIGWRSVSPAPISTSLAAGCYWRSRARWRCCIRHFLWRGCFASSRSFSFSSILARRIPRLPT